MYMTIYANESRAVIRRPVATVKVIQCTFVDPQLMKNEREWEAVASISKERLWLLFKSRHRFKLLSNSRNTSTVCWWMPSNATWPWNTGPVFIHTLIAKFMGLTWGPSGADRTQVSPILVPWTLLSGYTGTESCHHCACKYASTFSPLIQSWIQSYTSLFGSVRISTHPC